MSYDHLFASEPTPSLHLKIDNEGALGNVPSTPTKKTSTNIVFARNMPTKRGRWGREREREREREGERERERWEERRGWDGGGRDGEGRAQRHNGVVLKNELYACATSLRFGSSLGFT